MSIPTYAVVNDLPAPVTTGSTIQSFTDVWGEVWVAKNGVNAGQWRKARDVLYSQVRRIAAYTYPAAATAVPFDTIDRDPYGIWVPGSTGFVTPVNGMYMVLYEIYVTTTAASDYINVYITATQHAGGFGPVYSASNYPCVGSRFFQATAGQLIQLIVNARVALAMYTSANANLGQISYLGTG